MCIKIWAQKAFSRTYLSLDASSAAYRKGIDLKYGTEVGNIHVTNTKTLVRFVRKFSPPKPVLHWAFENNTKAEAGVIKNVLKGHKAHLQGKATVNNGALVLNGETTTFAASDPLGFELTEKTMEVVVQLDNLTQKGGGVMTLQKKAGEYFDSIVFGENVSGKTNNGKWVIGSELYHRSQLLNGDPEKEAQTRSVHIVVVYASDGEMSLYRNGKLYGKSYSKGVPLNFAKGEAKILFGLRHEKVWPDKMLKGRILDAKLYDRALTEKEVAGLKLVK